MLRTPRSLHNTHHGAHRLLSAVNGRRNVPKITSNLRCFSAWNAPARPRHLAGQDGWRQRRMIRTSTQTPNQRVNGKSFGASQWEPSSAFKKSQRIGTRHVSSDALRRELEEDAHSRASGHGLPQGIVRDIDAVESDAGPVEDSVSLGGEQHRDSSSSITVHVPGRHSPLILDAILARDSCVCPTCVDKSSKQKVFQTSDIPSDIKASWTLHPDTEELEIRWKNDIPGFPEDHTTRFSLKPADVPFTDSIYHPLEATERRIWDRTGITSKNKWTDYNRYMNDDAVLHETLEHLGRYGLVFLTGVPDDEKSVEHIVSRIGILKDTFYGRTWDVKSKPEAKNIAYTPQYLGLHMDLMYVTNPPHLQLLHSLRARSPGGASMFSDSFNAAHTLYHTERKLFDALTTLPVPFHYKNDSQSYFKWRPTIELAPRGLSPNPPNNFAGASGDPVVGPPIKCVNYSPPFQAPFAPNVLTDLATTPRSPYGPREFRLLHRALQRFAQLVESEEAMFEHRLNEGECVIFDNRRVLHARREFDATKGERWLKGAYVDDDVYYSRARALHERFAGRE